MEERTIDITKFLQARSQEIEYFTKQLDQKILFSSKQAYQSTPKHLRRRAMSHNRYRIPLRIRSRMPEKEIQQIEQTQDPISCRKTIRKPKLLAQAYVRRSKQSKWLETHLWHAKRMKMIEYFGYKVALNPNDKSKRACYRFGKKECCIYDKSYYNIIQISVQNNNSSSSIIQEEKDENKINTEKQQLNQIKQFMGNFVQQKQLKKLFSKKNIQGHFCMNEIFIYEQLNNNHNAQAQQLQQEEEQEEQEEKEEILIGSVQFFWKPNKTKNVLNMLYHPGCKDQILNSFENQKKNSTNIDIQLNCIQDNYNIFEIMGPQSVQKLHLLMQNLQLKNDSQEFLKIQDIFENINDPCQFPKNMILYINSEGKVSQKLITPPMGGFLQPTLETQDIQSKEYQFKIKEQHQKQNEYIIALTTGEGFQQEVQEKLNFQNNELFWSKLENCYQQIYDSNNKRYEVVNRSRYTHKKKNKFSKKEKKEFIVQQSKKNLPQQIDENVAKMSEQQRIQQELIEKLSSERLQRELEEKLAKEREEQEILRENLKKDTNFEMMIIFTNSNDQQDGFGGFQIIMPQNQGHIVWKIMNFLACKPIGLRDYNQNLHEQGVKVFPQDYPTTYTHKKLVQNQTQEMVARYIRRPPGNRANYEKLRSPFPFKSNWNYLLNNYFKNLVENNSKQQIQQLQETEGFMEIEQQKIIKQNQEEQEEFTDIEIQDSDLENVNIEMIQRGVPFERAYICEPLIEDLGLYQVLKEQNKPISYLFSEKKTIDNDNNTKEQLNQQKMSRKIIGFTTTGGFSFQRGRGYGKGQILKYYMDSKKNDDNQQTKLVLIRNVNSQYYFLAKILVENDDII